MYIPKSFRIDDPLILHDFIRTYSFAALITFNDDPFATHLPLLLDADRGPRGTLIGHFAKTNPHWEIDHAIHRSVAIFNGPHAYISPSWYRSGAPAVPTWNYAVVHARGKLSITKDALRTKAILDQTVQQYESGLPSPWVNRMQHETVEKLVASVVAFEMPIERIEGKFKLNQNRAAEDQAGAIEGLESIGDHESTALAALMRKYIIASRDSSNSPK